MSIFYEEDEIGGDYNQDKDDFTHPNHEDNYSDDDLYNEFNKIGDSYVKIKEHTSIFHDLDIVEEETVTKDKDSKKFDIKHKIFTKGKNSNNKFDKPISRKEAFGKKSNKKKEVNNESYSFLDDII